MVRRNYGEEIWREIRRVKFCEGGARGFAPVRRLTSLRLLCHREKAGVDLEGDSFRLRTKYGEDITYKLIETAVQELGMFNKLRQRPRTAVIK